MTYRMCIFAVNEENGETWVFRFDQESLPKLRSKLSELAHYDILPRESTDWLMETAQMLSDKINEVQGEL